MSPSSLPSLVLDTNAVLDLWWFRDPRGVALAQAIERGTVRWRATPAMREESLEVLGRPAFAGRPSACLAVSQALDRYVQWESAAVPLAPCRCADPDDQGFLDLAVWVQARWLVSRDRALLELAGQAQRWGCRILQPKDWAGVAPAEFTSAAGPGP